MTITFQGVLIVAVSIETILWIRSAWISDNRRVEINKLKKDYEHVKSMYKNECVTSERYRDMFCKKDNEVTSWQMKYKKCIKYIKKINEENKNIKY